MNIPEAFKPIMAFAVAGQFQRNPHAGEQRYFYRITEEVPNTVYDFRRIYNARVVERVPEPDQDPATLVPRSVSLTLTPPQLKDMVAEEVVTADTVVYWIDPLDPVSFFDPSNHG